MYAHAERGETNMKNKPDNTPCTWECAFCGARFQSEALTQVVLPATDEEPETATEVCATCLTDAQARGVELAATTSAGDAP